MSSEKRASSALMCVMLSLMILIMIIPTPAFAKEDHRETVRVAYVVASGYQEGGKGEYKTGYGYEYLQKIAEINGWKYEYVYGSFSELLEKLQNGEVDLMGNLSYTDERAKTISFGSYEQGRENYYLYDSRSHSTIDPLDYSTINGKKLGVNAGSNQEKVWKEWCKEHNVSCKIVEYTDLEKRRKDVNNGKLDGTLEGMIQQDSETEDWQVLLNFGSSPFYFGVNKERPDLLAKVNSAQKTILEENPFYNEDVHDRYMKTAALSTTKLDADEKTWLKKNGNLIKVGYLIGFQPISYQDRGGHCRGIAADLMAEMEEEYAEEDLHFEAVAYKTYDEMREDLKDGKISAAWAVYKDYWNADQNGFVLTDTVMAGSMILAFKGSYSADTVKKIGVNQRGSFSEAFAKIHYPESEIVEFSSYEKAASALLKGKVSSVLYETSIYQVDEVTNEKLHKFNTVPIPNTFDVSFAVEENHREVATILNKGIVQFSDAAVNRSLLTNSALDKQITVKAYLAQNPMMANLLMALLVGLLAALILFIIYKNMSVRVKTAKAEKELFEKLSNTDPLTGLYNRKAVFHVCRKLLDAHPKDSFVMLHVDIKHFRLFNTFFGDEVGDKLLCDIADLFRRVDDEYDYWAYGRVEADVFCAFFPYDREKYQRHIAEVLKLMATYRSDFLIEPAFGMYPVTDAKMPIESMFTRASMAAKEVQPSTPYATVVYDDKLEQKLKDEQQIINDMQTALAEEQFEVYLQPKYSLRNNTMVGAEALVRWNHPEKGLVSPGAFIPVFESNGFITELDHYMWEHVCMLLAKWRDSGQPILPVSVNVSRLSMYGNTTVAILKELVKKYELDPKYLQLELTESAYMDNPEDMKIQLRALRAAGFAILLDDFGSGYSSLNTLRDIPVDILKLDMRFLAQDRQDTRGGIIISSIVRMTKLLHLTVVAEGVELQEQADYLKSIGCEHVQGYLFARPMPVAAYEKLLAKGQTPLTHVNQSATEHVGKLIAETESATYSMGAIIPVPFACLEYADGNFFFLRVNKVFYDEFCLYEDEMPASKLFKEHLSEDSLENMRQAFEESIKTGRKVNTKLVWKREDGSVREYLCSAAYEGNIGDTATLVATFADLTNM